VARYVREEHALWLKTRCAEGKDIKDTDTGTFCIDPQGEKYAIETPTTEQYENNWSFKR